MAKKKNLCIITPVHWSQTFGGAEYQVSLLVEHILKHDNIHITCLSRKAKNGYQPSTYDLVKISKNNLFQRLGFFVDTLNLLKLFKKMKPDIIYQRVGCAYTGIAAFYAKKAGCKMIWHVSSDNDLIPAPGWWESKPNKFIDKKILQWGIKNAQAIIAQTEYQKKILEKANCRAPIHLVRNYHPLPEKNPINGKSDQIIWIANIKKLKQPELYLELAGELQKRNIKTKCLMIGAPATYPNGYQDVIKDRLKRLDNLTYLGKLPLFRVNEIIAQSKLLINTSKWEGFPNTFIQAWMRKTPVVSLNCDPDYIIRNYECGLVSGTFHKMVENVIYLLNNKQQRDKMGENAQTYAIKNHSLKNLDIMEKLILGAV